MVGFCHGGNLLGNHCHHHHHHHHHHDNDQSILMLNLGLGIVSTVTLLALVVWDLTSGHQVTLRMVKVTTMMIVNAPLRNLFCLLQASYIAYNIKQVQIPFLRH